jgi:hypothetical protein
MSRSLTDHVVNGLNEALIITVLDDPGQGGACHRYEIHMERTKGVMQLATEINFQNGPIKEAGVNGISQEALLAILIDRLKGFQGGEFSTKENAVALTHLETAMLWLHKRTRERIARGVEGTNVK